MTTARCLVRDAGSVAQNGEDEQEIGTASQDETGGFSYQDGGVFAP
jgi:hypothetical protein